MDISRIAQVNASTQMHQSQVAQTAQVLVLKKDHGQQATGALASRGNLGTQVTMA